MKKTLLWMLAFMLVCMALGCGSPSQASQVSAEEQPVAASEAVVFADPTLEQMVRATLGQPEGEITAAQAAAVTRLSLGIEWQRYLSGHAQIQDISGLEYFTNLEMLDLSYHAIADISPLAALTNLKALILSGCAAVDYSPLAGLTNLRVLILDHSTISDPTPLLALSNLNCLYLEGSQIQNYLPLADIRASLELADFNVALTLAELGFTFNEGEKLALYQTDKYDIRINHGEWGDPPQPDWQNLIRVVTVAESGYKNAIGYYPVHNAYVVWMYDPNTQEFYTYVYDVAANSFGCERESMEAIVRQAFGDVSEEDVLLTPFVFFDNTIQEALGIPIDVLYSMPFDENIVLQSQYEKLGFTFLDYKGTYTYQENNMVIDIHKPEWDKDVAAENRLDWSLSFFDPGVKDYQLLILYFADMNVYDISLEKDGTEIRFDYYPATNEFEYNPQSIEPFRAELIETFGDDFLNVPMNIFNQTVQERFNMSVEELYALPLE